MVDLLRDYVHYNAWANDRICKRLEGVIIQTSQESSFSSIAKTLLHIWDAQTIWLLRLQGKSLKEFPSSKFTGSDEVIFNGLRASSSNWIDFWNVATIDLVGQLIRYTDTKGNAYEQSIGTITLHCINHSTYHRGQIVTLMNQLGLKNIPSTDYIFYVRTK